MTDKIYSRRVIRVPKMKNYNPKEMVMVKVIVVLTIAFAVVFHLNRSIHPIFEQIARNKAKVIATEILNKESSKILKDIHYEDLVKIEKDSNNTVKMIKFDVIKMDILASDIAYNIQQELNKEENNTVLIPIGSLSGIPYLAGFGPKIKIKIIPAGSVITDFKSVFESKGINQTIHRIYLDVVCSVNIVSPYGGMEENILNQVLMAETVIVGEIPESYYNLEGMQIQDTVDLIN